ncbi:MAG: DUF92 domain-containing protein [Sphaerochaeta sp.]|jgi:uncharacterized protein (TIGR00297 family)|nr:DUF92 domain-containing protein [Sphaerochaeta sp.]MCH3920512.1 DUF92 domain-containing protein [Sphaerochaeta sp.]
MDRFANLVPDCLSFASHLNKWFFPIPYASWILLAVMLLLGFFAWKGRQLKVDGAVAAVVVGFGITWILGYGALFVMVLFFLGAGVMGKVSRMYRQERSELIQKKGGMRDSRQVLANGGLALVCAILYIFFSSPVVLVMFGAVIAEAASDTASGEIGVMSRQKPVSLLTGRPMPKGLSGAVTTTGLLAGLLSSAVIALCWLSNFFIPNGHAFLLAAIVTVSGFFGSVFDSFLGCTCQACYYDEQHDRLTEHEGAGGVKFQLEHGWPWMDNDMVNFLSNLSACIFSGLLALLLG